MQILLKQPLRLLILLCVFYSCDKSSTSDRGMTYVGGEVINPKMDMVILSKDNCIVDTLMLDDTNHFLFSGKKLESGLYSFLHGEYQKFYLEPGDSIMLRLNTMDFDESLTYTGRGSERNNLLMELFLSNEEDLKLLQETTQLSATDFELNIDLKRVSRLRNLQGVIKDMPQSRGFVHVARAAIMYNYYSMKEMYISMNKNPERREQIPAAFYDFRKDIDYGDSMLTTYYPYYQFLNRHLNNVASEELLDVALRHNLAYNHTQNKLDLIDRKITYDTLKNNLLRTTARSYLLRCNQQKDQQQVANKHSILSSNASHVKEISHILDATLKLTPGRVIPPIVVVDSENEAMAIANVIQKPTVIYFWSYNSVSHYKNIHSRAAELKERYPEYDFVAINTDTHFRKWRNIIGRNAFNLAREYQFENSNQAEKELVLTSINKAIVVDKDGVILESNTSLLKLTFESELLGFLN